LKLLIRIKNFVKAFKNILKKKEPYMDIIAKRVGIDKEKIEMIDHHTCHILASLYFADTNLDKRYLCFSIDGMGDNSCAKVGIWENNNLKIVSTTEDDYSLGAVYSLVTFYLGMIPLEHEFKVMGMAPYAKGDDAQRIKKVFEKLLWLDENGKFTSKLTRIYFMDYILDNLLFERFDSISGAIQEFCEEILQKWIKYWIEKTGINDITLGGGTMMNVKAVKKIYEMPEVNSVFVTPSAGDESLIIGALFHANQSLNQPIKKITHLYLGTQNDEIETENYLKSVSDRYDYQKLSKEQMTKTAAKLLSENKIIARCAGREEWGARALGNRSILCNASHFENIDILNQYIKDRDFWMPFTPSILKEDIDKYIVNPKNMSIPYMCITFDSTPLARQHIPAALHPYDKTVRPQAVDKNWNPDYHALISEFKKNTGNVGGGGGYRR
jgi:carbamoyltransferase